MNKSLFNSINIYIDRDINSWLKSLISRKFIRLFRPKQLILEIVY